jgi:hypothetical protein
MKTSPVFLPFMHPQALADISGMPLATIKLRIEAGQIPTTQVHEKTFIDLRPYLVVAKVLE